MNRETARDVAAALKLGECEDPPTFVARGAMGEIWKVRTDRGSWAVKALFPWADYQPLPPDIGVQLAAHAAGVLLPRPVVRDGAAVVHLDARSYRAYDWVDLAAPLQAAVGARTAAAAGSILATIHTLPVDSGTAVDDWYTTAPDSGGLLLVADAAERGDAWWSASLRDAIATVEDLRRFVSADHGAPRVCHRDFNVSNVVPSASTGELVTLDWENVGPVAQDEELASSVLGWCTAHGLADESSVTAFLDAYRAAGGPATITPQRSFSMAVCTTLNFLRVMAEQALEGGGHQSFAEGRLRSLLGSLPDLLTSIRSVSDLVA